jgi:hypothetical protein
MKKTAPANVAAVKITVQGARYPEKLEKMTGR